MVISTSTSATHPLDASSSPHQPAQYQGSSTIRWLRRAMQSLHVTSPPISPRWMGTILNTILNTKPWMLSVPVSISRLSR